MWLCAFIYKLGIFKFYYVCCAAWHNRYLVKVISYSTKNLRKNINSIFGKNIPNKYFLLHNHLKLAAAALSSAYEKYGHKYKVWFW